MTSFLSGLLSNPLDPGASARHASEAQNTASGLQQQASGYYNQLGNEGSALTSLYNANISPLLSLYGQYGGVGNVLTNPTSANTPSTTAGGAASGTTTSGTGSTASGSNATSVLNPAPSQSAPSANPYQLTGSQQQVLNENLAQVANQQNAATQSYKQSMEQAGITDPRDLAVGEEYISQQYATQKQNSPGSVSESGSGHGAVYARQHAQHDQRHRIKRLRADRPGRTGNLGALQYGTGAGQPACRSEQCGRGRYHEPYHGRTHGCILAYLCAWRPVRGRHEH